MALFDDSTSLLFTDIPREIVTVWTPTVVNDHKTSLLRSVTVTVKYSDDRDTHSAPLTCDVESQTSRLGEWKQAMKLYDDLTKSTQDIIIASPRLYSSTTETAKSHLRRQQWRNPTFDHRVQLYDLTEDYHRMRLLEDQTTERSTSSRRTRKSRHS